eukprot:scaffold81234_cov66-Phaeocystis_antarctica.AAC.1
MAPCSTTSCLASCSTKRPVIASLRLATLYRSTGTSSAPKIASASPKTETMCAKPVGSSQSRTVRTIDQETSTETCRWRRRTGSQQALVR